MMRKCDGCELYDYLVYNYKYEAHFCDDCEDGSKIEVEDEQD